MKPLGTGDPVRLGPYRLLGVLGEGGMGKVYVGQDGGGTLTAVKVLRPELAYDTQLAQRFVREAQAAQAVQSKGVAAVLGAQTDGARPWIATEFLAGLTLDQAVDTYGPFAEPALRALAVSLSRTLADIHAAGFIHRDLKPPNIVLTSQGPRVIDFGIARPEHGLTLTTTGQVPVTPGYGAPEQVLGKRVTSSADVFSLGAVLVYAASGRRAFDGAHVAALQYEVVHGEPQLGDIAAQLQELIAPCLAKDPAVRPTPAQIAQAMEGPKATERVWRQGPLANAIKERETDAHRLTTYATAQIAGGTVPVTRRRLFTGLAAGGVVLAAGGGSTAWWLGSRVAQDSAVGAKSDPFDIPPAVAAPKARLGSQVRASSTTLGEPTILWSLEDEADIYSPELLPVRDVIVFGAADGGIAAHDVKNSKRRWSAPHIVVKSGYLSLSDRLVIGTDDEGTLRTFVPSTGEPKWTCPAAEAATLLAADAEAVYFITKDDRLRSVRRSDAKVRWTVSVPADFRKKLANHAVTGRGTLVVPTSDGNVLAVHTSNGRQAWTRRDHADVSVRPAVHGDTVYLNGKTLEARRLSDGESVWSTELDRGEGNWDQWGPPAVNAQAVYAVGGLHPRRLDRTDGSQVWSGSGRYTAFTASPVVLQANGVWSIDSDDVDEDTMGVKTARAADGEWIWRYDLPMFDYRLRMAAAGNRFFVMDDSAVTALMVF